MEKIKELAFLFFKLGSIAFGGPAAHIAMMEDEVVKKRRWMTREYFLDLVGATNLIPGPNSTEMAMHIGLVRAGWLGFLVAGICFILPAVFLTGLLAFLYARFGTIPEIKPFLFGIRPAVIAIMLGAVYKLGAVALKNQQLYIIGFIAAGCALAGLSEVLIILLGGIFGMVWLNVPKSRTFLSIVSTVLLQTSFPLSAMAANATAIGYGVSLSKIFLVFLKIGAVLFGSGYVLVAFLQSELIDHFQWITQKQLLDAVAIGQLTPGPVLSTATFIGYQLWGIPGAALATIGIFLPAFIFVAISGPLIPYLRRSKWSAGFLDTVNVCALGIMMAVTLQLMNFAVIDWRTGLIAVISALLLIFVKNINSLWIVAGSSLVGLVLYYL